MSRRLVLVLLLAAVNRGSCLNGTAPYPRMTTTFCEPPDEWSIVTGDFAYDECQLQSTSQQLNVLRSSSPLLNYSLEAFGRPESEATWSVYLRIAEGVAYACTLDMVPEGGGTMVELSRGALINGPRVRLASASLPYSTANVVSAKLWVLTGWVNGDALGCELEQPDGFIHRVEAFDSTYAAGSPGIGALGFGSTWDTVQVAALRNEGDVRWSPTPKPTATDAPTADDQPTAAPTPRPTTQEPTPRPTFLPTLLPTTLLPTPEPTVEPTPMPTPTPTPTPAPAPPSPTYSPSREPTQTPTLTSTPKISENGGDDDDDSKKPFYMEHLWLLIGLACLMVAGLVICFCCRKCRPATASQRPEKKKEPESENLKKTQPEHDEEEAGQQQHSRKQPRELAKPANRTADVVTAPLMRSSSSYEGWPNSDDEDDDDDEEKEDLVRAGSVLLVEEDDESLADVENPVVSRAVDAAVEAKAALKTLDQVTDEKDIELLVAAEDDLQIQAGALKKVRVTLERHISQLRKDLFDEGDL